MWCLAFHQISSQIYIKVMIMSVFAFNIYFCSFCFDVLCFETKLWSSSMNYLHILIGILKDGKNIPMSYQTQQSQPRTLFARDRAKGCNISISLVGFCNHTSAWILLIDFAFFGSSKHHPSS